MKLWRTTAAIGFAALQVGFAGTHHAAAQTNELDTERQSVLQRSRPDYDPLGAHLGSFLLYPSADLSETYNSNVFVTPTNTKADLLTTFSPAVQLRSNWNNDALNFVSSGQIKRYATQVGENNSNALAGTDGRLDIERDVYLTGRLSYQLLHEDRASPNTVLNQKNPTEYQQASAGSDFVHESGRLGLRVGGGVDYYTYNNEATLTNTIIPETGRNRVEYNFGPRVSYEIVPGYEAFVQARGNYRQYMSEFATGGLDTTSHGYAVDAGTAVHLGATMNGEVFAGWFAQDYNDARLAPVSGPHFGGALLWNVTQQTSIRGSLARTVEETIVIGASSFVQTLASVSVEHELRRNVLLNAGAAYVIQDFQGVVRTDTTYLANVGARYMITRNLNSGVGVTWSQRDSTAPGNNYDQILISADVKVQF